MNETANLQTVIHRRCEQMQRIGRQNIRMAQELQQAVNDYNDTSKELHELLDGRSNKNSPRQHSNGGNVENAYIFVNYSYSRSELTLFPNANITYCQTFCKLFDDNKTIISFVCSVHHATKVCT